MRLSLPWFIFITLSAVFASSGLPSSLVTKQAPAPDLEDKLEPLWREINSKTNFKDKLDTLWKEINKSLPALTAAFPHKALCKWLYMFQIAKLLTSSNILVLAKSLDILIEFFFRKVCSLPALRSSCDVSLDELDYLPTDAYLLGLNKTCLMRIKDCIQLNAQAKIVMMTLFSIQNEVIKAVGEQKVQMISDQSRHASDCRRLVKNTSSLLEYFDLYQFFHSGKKTAQIVVGCLKDAALLYQMLGPTALTMDSFLGKKFGPADLIPLFLSGLMPHPNGKKGEDTCFFGQDAKLEYAVYRKSMESINHYSVLLCSALPIKRSMHVTIRAFPSIAERIERIQSLFESIKSTILDGDGKLNKTIRTMLAFSAFSIEVLQSFEDQALAVGLLAEKTTDVMEKVASGVRLAECDVIMVIDETSTFVAARNFLSMTIETMTACKRNDELPEFVPILFELKDLLYSVLLDQLKTRGELLLDPRASQIFEMLNQRVNCSKFRLGKITEVVALWDAVILQTRQELMTTPFVLQEHITKDKSVEMPTSPAESVTSPHDNIDSIVAQIEGLKPRKKSETKKKRVKAPVVLKVDEETWDEPDTTSEPDESSESDERGASEGSNLTAQIVQTSRMVSEASIPHQRPLHIIALLDEEDMCLLREHDPRDIAHGYLMLGNALFYRYILPFIRALEDSSIYIYPAFQDSMAKFESEVRLLALMKPDLIEAAFFTARITDMTFINGCLKFYEKRLKVAHQHVPQFPGLKKEVLRLHLAMLCNSSHPKYGHGRNLIEKGNNSLLKLDSMLTFEPFNRRSATLLPSCELVSFELAVLGLTSMLNGKDVTGGCRHAIAHFRPNPNLLAALLETVFKESPHQGFLKAAFNQQ